MGDRKNRCTSCRSRSSGGCHGDPLVGPRWADPGLDRETDRDESVSKKDRTALRECRVDQPSSKSMVSDHKLYKPCQKAVQFEICRLEDLFPLVLTYQSNCVGGLLGNILILL